MSSHISRGSQRAKLAFLSPMLQPQANYCVEAVPPFSDLPPCLLLRRYGDQRISNASAELHDL